MDEYLWMQETMRQPGDELIRVLDIIGGSCMVCLIICVGILLLERIDRWREERK
jgi:hypothetical protein